MRTLVSVDGVVRRPSLVPVGIPQRQVSVATQPMPAPRRMVNAMTLDGIAIPRSSVMASPLTQTAVMPMPAMSTPMPMPEPEPLFDPYAAMAYDTPYEVSDDTFTDLAHGPNRSTFTWPYKIATAVLVPAIVATSYVAWQAWQPAQATPAPAVVAAPPIAQVQQASTPESNLAAHQAALQSMLESHVAAYGAPMSVVIKDLKTGETASVGGDQVYTSASLYKLFVAQGIFQRIDEGKLAPGRATGGGTGRNVVDCTRIMINISDNACGKALGDITGWKTNFAAMGYPNTNLGGAPLKTTANDVATLLEKLYRGTLLSPSSTETFMGMLKQQRVNNRLPVGLPAGTVVAHKTGDLNGFSHDAGIVYGPKTDYLVVVTSGPWKSTSESSTAISSLSQKVFAHFQ